MTLDDIGNLLLEIKGDIVSLQTEVLLMKYAIEQIEEQVNDLHSSKNPVEDPFANIPNAHIEKF